MDMNNVVGRVLNQSNFATKDADGYWHMKCSFVETATFSDGTEKEEFIESEAMDKDFYVAYQVALESVLLELRALTSLRGFDSLIDGMEYERKLEAENGSNSKADEDTPTQ
jgi:hypothetical protein